MKKEQGPKFQTLLYFTIWLNLTHTSEYWLHVIWRSYYQSVKVLLISIFLLVQNGIRRYMTPWEAVACFPLGKQHLSPVFHWDFCFSESTAHPQSYLRDLPKMRWRNKEHNYFSVQMTCYSSQRNPATYIK